MSQMADGRLNKRGSAEVQEHVRKLGMKMLRVGKKPREIAELLEVSRRTVEKWRLRIRLGGEEAYKSQPRGPKDEAAGLLTEEEQLSIRVAITGCCPDELNMPFLLWTRQAVKELIQDRTGKKLGLTTVGNYLQRWGFSPQRPAHKAYEQQSDEVKKWLDEEYPKLKTKAKKEGAQIHWADETRCQNTVNAGRSYAPIGQTPIRLKSGNRKLSVNMISSISNQGQMRFMIYEKNMDHKTFIKFLSQLIRSSEKKIILIVDNLKVHHAKKVDAWIKKHAERIEIAYLPRYSPELNPDEYLNQDIKSNVHKKRMPRNLSEMKENLRSFLMSIQRKKGRVASYFQNFNVQYAL